jgi:hypothetical protein
VEVICEKIFGTVGIRTTFKQFTEGSLKFCEYGRVEIKFELKILSFVLCFPSCSALQRHYAILEAFALGEDDADLPDPRDDTMPPEEQMQKYAVNI